MGKDGNTKRQSGALSVLAGSRVGRAAMTAPVIGGQPLPEVPPGEQWPFSEESIKKAPRRSLWDPTILRPAFIDALRKLDPRHRWRNPVMFIVEVGALITTAILIGN